MAALYVLTEISDSFTVSGQGHEQHFALDTVVGGHSQVGEPHFNAKLVRSWCNSLTQILTFKLK